jgi:hypothetical protein
VAPAALVANVITRSIGAFAATTKLVWASTWRAAPSSSSMNAEHDGHGPSASASSAVAPLRGPGRSSCPWRGNMKL